MRLGPEPGPLDQECSALTIAIHTSEGLIPAGFLKFSGSQSNPRCFFARF